MAKLEWDKTGEHFYETGVEQVALYVQKNGVYSKGVAWSGVSAINENPSGGENSDVYADDQKYLTLQSIEKYGATIEAYQYPEEFEECDGSKEIATGVYIGQQKRSVFGLAYITKIGNDTDGDEAGEKLHLVYGAQAQPSDRSNKTMNESPEADTMSWEISTTPVKVEGYKATSTIVIDSRKADPTKYASFKKKVYGDTSDAELPLPADVITHFGTLPVGG